MSNRFLCNFNARGDVFNSWSLSESLLDQTRVFVNAYYFFYCTQPSATSASIQGVRTNLREYYVKRLKIDYIFCVQDYTPKAYVMVFVLNVPENYVPSKVLSNFRLSDLPNHTIPNNVLYYNFIPVYTSGNEDDGYTHTKDFIVDIKKPFKVSPGYKLVFLFYQYTEAIQLVSVMNQGSAQVFFEVN